MLALFLGLMDFDETIECTKNLKGHIIGYIIILGLCVLLEMAVAYVSMRGTILSPEPRKAMEYILYIRLGELQSI